MAEDRDTDVNRDRILLFEHNPVYTLGRGADEKHLAFLDSDPDGKEAANEKRRKLSRKARGPESARLAVDRSNTVGAVSADADDDAKLDEAVDALAGCCSPVYAPNDAPIYRVERGGEVTLLLAAGPLSIKSFQTTLTMPLSSRSLTVIFTFDGLFASPISINPKDMVMLELLSSRSSDCRFSVLALVLLRSRFSMLGLC